LAGQAESELQVKNSKFIGTATQVWNEPDALAFLNKMRTKYKDASHNVFAFRVLTYGFMGDESAGQSVALGSLLERQSDDGEPSGTAGKPVLDIISGMGLVNVCVNVTRYFGGTLLGTGGLVRAYQETVRKTLLPAQLCEYRRLLPARLNIPYSVYNKFLHASGAYTDSYRIAESAFTDDVCLDIICAEDSSQLLRSTAISLAQSARLAFGKPYYGVL